jgi:hypothetical protein
MDLVERLKKLADELPNYPQLELHQIASEVLALQGKLDALTKELEIAYEREHDSNSRCISLPQYENEKAMRIAAEGRLDSIRRAVADMRANGDDSARDCADWIQAILVEKLETK